MTIRYLDLAALGVIAVATSLVAIGTAQADNSSWGWNSPPKLGNDVTALMQDAWQEPDGSRGQVLALAAGKTSSLQSRKGDAKIVVIQGQIQVAGLTVKKGGYAIFPSTPAHEVSCVSEVDCLTYVETEPTQSVIEPLALTASDIPWFDVPNTGGNVSLAWVWGAAENAAPSSFFLRFQPGFPGFQHVHTHGYHGVVLQGDYSHWEPDDAEHASLSLGTTFWQHGGHAHDDACDIGENVPCIAYFRIENTFDVFQAE